MRFVRLAHSDRGWQTAERTGSLTSIVGEGDGEKERERDRERERERERDKTTEGRKLRENEKAFFVLVFTY